LTNSTAVGLGEQISYDVMGNITQMVREGYGTNNYTGYNGNQLTAISGFTNGGYTYDDNGNVKTGPEGLSLTYNYLNLPSTATKTNTGLSSSYVYDATGQKLRKQSNLDGTSDYVSGIHYENNSIAFIQTEEGRALASGGGNYNYQYNLNDHLGNVRVSFWRNPNSQSLEIVQQDNYYAFGLRKAVSGISPDNKYLYNGKELQNGLDQLDYGARFYDPVIGRWNVVDPLAELGRRWSPYTYCFNNPIIFVDPDGMWGDYYDREGKHLGNDGEDDGKVYLLNEGVRAKTENKNINWGGELSESASNQLKAKSEEVGGLIILNRTDEGKDVTIGEFTTNDGSVSGFMAEPGGPSTTASGTDKRIPEGVYDLSPHASTKYPGSFKVSNDEVSKGRAILIHAGNTGADTEGCLMPGTAKTESGVSGSKAKRDEVYKFIKYNNKDNPVKLIINDNIK
jgi:RHS repeat-associated protein